MDSSARGFVIFTAVPTGTRTDHNAPPHSGPAKSVREEVYGAISVYAADLDGARDAGVVAGWWNDSTLERYESNGSPPAFMGRCIAI
jgi:hypothetical protein